MMAIIARKNQKYILLLKGFNPIVSTINTWYIVVARAINDEVGAP